jgi:drug/metabolite transporter (DMT)-like permease
MNPSILALTLLSVTISALGQITLKLGVSTQAVRQAMASSSSIDFFWALALNPLVVAGFALYGLGAISWVMVLTRVDVSQAYPFVGLSILLAFALGHFLLSEPVSLMRIAGMVLIVGGVILVAQN